MKPKYNYKKFIVIEGINGTGKSTQAQLLASKLKAEGKPAVYIHFPNYDDPTGVAIKNMLDGKYGEYDDLNPFAISTLYAVNRYNSINKDYKEYFFSDKGYYIISDRYTSSNLLYQSSAILSFMDIKEDDTKNVIGIYDQYFNWLTCMENGLFKLPTPDQIILLQINPEVASKRLAARGTQDIHEQDDMIRKSYDIAAIYAKMLNWDVLHIDEKDTIKQVCDNVRSIVDI